MDVAISKNGVPIRLTSERWQHISVGHPEMADFYFEIFDTIENPETIIEGSSGEIMVIGEKHKLSGKFVVVIYKETDKIDGFVITAYLSNKQLNFEKKKILWKR